MNTKRHQPVRKAYIINIYIYIQRGMPLNQGVLLHKRDYRGNIQSGTYAESIVIPLAREYTLNHIGHAKRIPHTMTWG